MNRDDLIDGLCAVAVGASVFILVRSIGNDLSELRDELALQDTQIVALSALNEALRAQLDAHYHDMPGSTERTLSLSEMADGQAYAKERARTRRNGRRPEPEAETVSDGG